MRYAVRGTLARHAIKSRYVYSRTVFRGVVSDALPDDTPPLSVTSTNFILYL
jgi:hypothetical protein